MKPPVSILVIKPSSLGDVIHVFPALEVLRRAFPGAELDFFIHPAFQELLELSPFPVRRKILFQRQKLSSLTGFPRAFASVCRELREEHYDLVIDFQGLLRSAFFASLTRSDVVAGFDNPKESAARWFYSRRIAVDRTLHAVKRNVLLINGLLESQEEVPELAPPVLPGIAEKFNLPGRFVILAPGARWTSKAFPPKLFAGTASLLSRQCPELSFVITGTPADSAAAEELMTALEPGVRAVNLTGKTTLLELYEVMRRAEFLLCNDSGPMHIAAFAGTRVCAFFGPTRPELTGPWGSRHIILRKTDLECLGCLKRECPCGKRCFQLEPEELVRTLIHHWKG